MLDLRRDAGRPVEGVVSVRGDVMGKILLEQAQGKPPHRRSEATDERAGGDRRRRACVHELAQRLDVAVERGTALRVCDQYMVPMFDQRVGDLVEAGDDRREGWLEQHPSTATERETLDLVWLQLSHARGGDLGAWNDFDLDALGRQTLVHSIYERRDRGMIVLVAPAHMRGCDDPLDACSRGYADQGDRVLKCVGTVVDVWKDVTVEIDQHPQRYGADWSSHLLCFPDAQESATVTARIASQGDAHDRTGEVVGRVALALARVVDELARLPAEVRVHFEPELMEVRRELSKLAARAVGNASRPDAGLDAVLEQTAGVAETNGGGDGGADGPDDAGFVASAGTAANAVADVAAAEIYADVSAVGIVADVSTVGIVADASAVGIVADASGVEIELPRFAVPDQRSDWLSKAIEALARSCSPALAGEFVRELVPLHARLCDEPLTYELRIDDADSVNVQIGSGYATVSPARDDSRLAADFWLEGSAAAFATVAGGGFRGRHRGLRVHGSRRSARRLFTACRRPVALADLAHAGITVWPGLLLASLVEAVAPHWTKDSAFVVAYEIIGAHAATFHVKARDGAPLALSVGVADDESEPAPLAEQPNATVRLNERAFLCMLAGVPLPEGQRVTFTGDEAAVHKLLGWFARAQGLTEVAPPLRRSRLASADHRADG